MMEIDGNIIGVNRVVKWRRNTSRRMFDNSGALYIRICHLRGNMLLGLAAQIMNFGDGVAHQVNPPLSGCENDASPTDDVIIRSRGAIE